MKKIKTFIKKHWKKILLIIIVLIFVQKIFIRFGGSEVSNTEPQSNTVELFTIGQTKDSFLDAFCSVETVSDATIISEKTGKIVNVSVKEGDAVKKGDTLFSLENIQERVVMQNAKVALQSAKLALLDLENDNNSNVDSSLVNQTKKQQEILISDAYNNYLNTDLQAYPSRTSESTDAPTISGNYICDTEGTYNLDVYASNSRSGSSIRISGLESGTMELSTDYPVAMGACGLEIVFPENFRKISIWTLQVPNTRSAGYVAARKSYEAAVSGKDIALNTITASREQIDQQKARVTQAELQLESAYDALSKTIITSPISGILSSFDMSVGDFVSGMQTVARVQSLGQTEFIAYVNADEMGFLSAGNTVNVEGKTVSITDISPSLDSVTKKVKVTISGDDTLSLDPGNQYSCLIERTFKDNLTLQSEGGVMVPLSAVSVIGVDPYIFVISSENIAVQTPIETGALLGDMVMIFGGFNDVSIISDARGIRDGQTIIVE